MNKLTYVFRLKIIRKVLNLLNKMYAAVTLRISKICRGAPGNWQTYRGMRKNLPQKNCGSY